MVSSGQRSVFFHLCYREKGSFVNGEPDLRRLGSTLAAQPGLSWTLQLEASDPWTPGA